MKINPETYINQLKSANFFTVYVLQENKMYALVNSITIYYSSIIFLSAEYSDRDFYPLNIFSQSFPVGFFLFPGLIIQPVNQEYSAEKWYDSK